MEPTIYTGASSHQDTQHHNDHRLVIIILERGRRGREERGRGEGEGVGRGSRVAGRVYPPGRRPRGGQRARREETISRLPPSDTLHMGMEAREPVLGAEQHHPLGITPQKQRLQGVPPRGEGRKAGGEATSESPLLHPHRYQHVWVPRMSTLRWTWTLGGRDDTWGWGAMGGHPAAPRGSPGSVGMG